MDVQVRDGSALRRVSPAALNAYLDSTGWVRRETWQNRISVWSRTDYETTTEILVPLREQSDAYAVRISEAIAILAEIEECSQLDVYYNLIGSGADVIRIRSLNGIDRADLSINESVDLLSRARDLVLAAARAAERPGQPVYRGRTSSAVQDYVQGVRPMPGYGAGIR